MDACYDAVRAFHEAFGVPLSDSPELLSSERVNTRSEWMIEEITELKNADTLVDQADAMIDLIYFALGTLVEMGVKPGALFDIVHEANMAKLWPDGKPRYRDDSKVIKPPGWQDPYPKLEQAVTKGVR